MNTNENQRDTEQGARDVELDASLREAVLADDFDSAAVEHSVRRRIASERASVRRGKWFLAATVAVIGVVVTMFVTRELTTPGIYADAARDHRREVIDHERRNWASDQAGVGALAVRAGLTAPQVAALVPAGYRFERAKLCRLEGKVFLHLVYSDGTREFSFFLRPNRADSAAIDAVHTHALCVTTFATPSLAGLIVTDQPGDSALTLARFVSRTTP